MMSFGDLSSLCPATILHYVRIHEKARAPYAGSEKAAGMDLFSVDTCVIPPAERRLIGTGLQIAIPDGHYGRIAPRSGLAVQHSIDCGAGVIDADYRGEVKVLLFNYGRAPFKVWVGDRIAQLICEKISHPLLQEVEELPARRRGEGGFGSTGIQQQ